MEKIGHFVIIRRDGTMEKIGHFIIIKRSFWKKVFSFIKGLSF